VNSCAPQGQAVPVPTVTPIVLLVLNKRWRKPKGATQEWTMQKEIDNIVYTIHRTKKNTTQKIKRWPTRIPPKTEDSRDHMKSVRYAGQIDLLFSHVLSTLAVLW